MERCNCKNQARLVAIVRGNDFALEAHASVYDQDKGIHVPFDLSEATDVTISAVGRYTKAEGAAVAVAGNKVTARFSGALAEGLYGVEILFRDAAGRGRIFERDLFAVVGDSSEATTGTVSEGGSGDGLDISVDVRSRVVRIGRTAVVSDYRVLSNKPSIGGVELDGDKTLEELGLESTTLVVTIDLEHPNEDGSFTPSHTPQEIRQAFLDGKTVFLDVPILGTRAVLSQSDESGKYNEFVGHVSINSGEKNDYYTFWWIVGETLDLNDAYQFPEYTIGEKKKLRNIEEGAQKNVQPDWAETNSAKNSFVRNKPTKLSQFTDDKGYATKADLNNKLDRPIIVDISANSVEVNCTELSGRLYSGSGVTALAISAAKTSGTKSGAEDVFQFSTGASPAITVTGVSWANSDVPTFEANKTYEIHIIYNATLDKFLATYAVYE